MTLASGDNILPSSAITIVANGGITLSGNNALGGPSIAVNLTTTYGALTIGSGSTVYGNLTAASGAVSLTNSALTGNISTNGTVSLSGGSVSGNVSGRNGITTSSTAIGGNVTANNGSISLTGGRVGGSVHSNCCAVTTNDTDVGNGVSSNNNTVTINGGSISGPIYTSGGTGIVINDAVMTGGSITTQNVPIVISNSIIGSPTSPVDVTTNHRVTVTNNSEVYGYVEGAPWQDPETVVSADSVVHGECVNGSHSSSAEPGKYNLRCDGDPTGGGMLHHIRIEHAGSGITCMPTTLTIKACKDADCNDLFTGGVTGSLTTTGAPTVSWIGGASFTIDDTGETTKSVHVTTAGTVTWGSDVGTTHCYVGAAASCDFTAADAGFVIDVPHHVSAEWQYVTLRAVRKSDETQKCVAALSGMQTVQLACAYENPDSGTVGLYAQGTLACAGFGETPAWTPASFHFSAQGEATFSLRYDDAGRVKFMLRHEGSGNTAGLVMTGEDSFVARPQAFVFSGVGADDGAIAVPGIPNESAATGNSNKWIAAGKAFGFTLTAINASGDATPNFGREQVSEAVLIGSELVAPAGGANPALGTPAGTPTFIGGVYTASGYSWAEVGYIRLTAKLGDGSYLGADPVEGTSPIVGRFIPYGFTVTPEDGLLNPFCNGFSYAGQPIQGYALAPRFRIDAHAYSAAAAPGYLNPAPLSNYRGEFMRLPTGGVKVSLVNADHVQLGKDGANRTTLHRHAGTPSLSVDPGTNELLYQPGNDVYIYERNDNAATPPYAAAAPLEIFSVRDQDGVETMNLGALAINRGVEIRYGRGVGNDTYGTAGNVGDKLSVALRAQLLGTGGVWSDNTADGCTVIPYSLEYQDITAAAAPASPVPLTGGLGLVQLTVTASTVQGETVVRPTWPVCDPPMTGCTSSWLPGPEAVTARFGIFRSDRRIIHWREAP